MIFWISYNIILSLLIIALSHQLYNYCVSHFTKPKIVDLIHQPKEKYNDILDQIQNENTLPIISEIQMKDDESVSTNMADELQQFLTSQIQNENT